MLVFEYVDLDLKKYLSKFSKEKGLEMNEIKVLNLLIFKEFLILITEGNRSLPLIKNLTQRFKALKPFNQKCKNIFK